MSFSVGDKVHFKRDKFFATMRRTVGKDEILEVSHVSIFLNTKYQYELKFKSGNKCLALEEDFIAINE